MTLLLVEGLQTFFVRVELHAALLGILPAKGTRVEPLAGLLERVLRVLGGLLLRLDGAADLREPVERLAAGLGLLGGKLVRKLIAPGEGLALGLLQLLAASGLLFPGGELGLRVRDLGLNLRQTAVFVEAPAAHGGADAVRRLGDGGALLAGLDDRGDAALELRAAAAAGELALADEGRTLEDLLRHAEQRVAGGGIVDAADGVARAAVNDGALAHRRAGAALPRECDGHALVFNVHGAGHRHPAPRGEADLVGLDAALFAGGAVHTVEHGADEAAPGRLAALVRREDNVETVAKLERVVLQRPEGRGHFSYPHSGPPPFSMASRP